MIVRARSTDRGRTRSAKRPLTEPRYREGEADPFWNRPRVSALADGRLLVAVDSLAGPPPDRNRTTFPWVSDDGGRSWAGRWTRNASAAVTDVESRLAASRGRPTPASCRRRRPEQPRRHGTHGGVRVDDGEAYVVDDAPERPVREPPGCGGGDYDDVPEAFVRGAGHERDLAIEAGA